MKLVFVFGDWFTVAFGPKKTMDHLEWIRVLYSLLAILVALVSLLLPVRMTGLQLGLTIGAFSFPVYGLVVLNYCEGFPAPSFTILYLVLSVCVSLSYATGHLFWYASKIQKFAKTLYVFVAAPLFVSLLVRRNPAQLCLSLLSTTFRI